MAVNIVRKSKNEDEEEKRKQLLAQMQENSQARKNAEIQAVKNSNVKFNNPYLGGGTYLAGKYVSGLGEGTTNIVSAPMQTLALGFQQGSKQASKEQTTWDKIKNIGKNTFKTFAYADPTMITRLMYDTTVGRDEFIQNANEVNTQIQQNASQADSTWKKATAYLGGYGSYIQKQYLNSGLNQLQTGAQSVGQVLGSEKSQQASQALLQADDKLHEPIDKLNEELSKSEGAQNKVIRRLGNASYTIGNMTPSILISALSGGAGASDATREALSLTSMGISAKGGSTREGLKQGLDLSTAERIGVSKGMVEVGTEKMWNGLSFLKSPDSKVGSAIRTWIGKQVEDRIKSQFGKTVLTKWIPDLAGESLEEFVSGIYDNWLDRATVDPNRGNFFKEQSLDTLIDTTLSTLLMNAPSYVLETKAIHDRNKSGNQTNVNTEESNGYKQNLQEMVNNLNIPNEMKAELQQTIDSNETITGEEYNNTKERIKSLVKLNTQQQIDSLSNDLNNQYIDIGNRLSELDTLKQDGYQEGRESRKIFAQQLNANFDDPAFNTILGAYPENRNGRRTVGQYKEIAKAYGQQMALDGLSVDEVRRNAVSSFIELKPARRENITQYDNRDKTHQSYDRMKDVIWTKTIYDSYKDTMRTQLQQQQEALSTQMNDELTRLQDEENILIDTIDNLKPKASPEQVARTKKLIEDFAKARGVNVEYNAEVFKNNNEEGFIKDKGNGERTIYINPNADTDTILVKLATHEMFHDTIRTQPHDKLTQLVMDRLKADENYDMYRQSVVDAYLDELNKLENTNKEALTIDELTDKQNALIDEEMTAKYLGEYLGDEQFVQQLVNSTNRTTIQKIMDWIDNRLQQIKNVVTGNKEAEYWRKVRENFEKAYNSKYQGQEGTQYSKELENQESLFNMPTEDTKKSETIKAYEDFIDRYNQQFEKAKEIIQQQIPNLKMSNIINQKNSTSGSRIQITTPDGKKVFLYYEGGGEFVIGNGEKRALTNQKKGMIGGLEEVIDYIKSDILNENTRYSKKTSFDEALQQDNKGRELSNEQNNTNVNDNVITDNQGNKLSTEYKNFLKNSQAKTENGNPIKLYHGTDKAGFNKVEGYLYLTPNREIAQDYAGSKETYNPNEPNANLTDILTNEGDKTYLKTVKYIKDNLENYKLKDLQVIWDYIDENNSLQDAFNDYEVTRDQLNSPIKDLKNTDIMDIVNATKHELEELEDTDTINKLPMPILEGENANDFTTQAQNRKIYEVYANIENPYEVDLKGGKITPQMIEDAKANGYDGIIAHNSLEGRNNTNGDTYIVFNENQLIDANNSNVRYSKKTDFDNFLNENNYKFTTDGRLETDKLSEKQIKTLLNLYKTTGYEDVSPDFIRSRLENNSLVIPREVADRFIEKELGYKPKFDTTKIYEDAEGRKLTKEQVEFYKDSDVRDIQGRLIPVYHRTNADFTIFDKNAGKQHGNKYGSGFYFSITPENYGNNTMEVYLNAKEGEYKYIPKKGYYIVQNANQIKNIDNLNPTENPDIRYSKKTKFDEALNENIETTNNGKNLLALHNLSEDKLRGVLELGGFPVPSIAVTNPNIVNHNQFGNITVVFNKDTINPEADTRNEVYDRDVWSPTFPTIEYDINVKPLSKVRNIVGGYGNEYLSRANSKLNNIEEIINRNGYEGLKEELKDNKDFKYVYYKTLNPDFKIFTKTDTKDVSTRYSNEFLQEFIDEYGKEIPSWGSIEDSQRKEIVNKFKEKWIPLLEQRRDAIIEEENKKENPRMFVIGIAKSSVDSNLEWIDSLGGQDKLIEDLNEIQRTGGAKEVNDYQKTNDYINDNINQKDYEKWIDDNFKEIVGKKGIYNGKEYLTSQGNRRTFNQLHEDYNLRNLVKEITKQSTIAGETGFGAGQNFGTLQAKMANKFNSIEDIKNAESKIQYDENSKELMDNYSNKIYDYMNQLREYSYNKDHDYFYGDNAGYALNDFADYKTQNVENLKKALENNGINSKEVPNELLNNVVNTINDLKNIPTDYFEAKPQRAVDFSEIDTVVLPSNTSEDIKQALSDRGIKYIEYDSNNENARSDILKALDEYKFNKKAKAFDDYLKANNPNRSGVTIGDLQQKLPTKETKLPTQQSNIANDYIKFRELTEQVKNGDITEAEFDRLSNLDDIQQELKNLGKTDKQVQDIIFELGNLRDNQLNERDINNLINLMGMNAYDREVVRNKIAKGETLLPTTNVQATTENLEIPNEQTSLPLGEQVNPSERKQRKTYKSIIESPVMSEEAKKVARKFIGQDTYTPDSNLKQLERADNIISRLGVEKALNQLESNAMEGRTIKAEDIATGDRLIEYYSKIGDSENLQRAIRATAMAGTQAGRSVQAFALLKHQTPRGMAVWIQKSVDKLNSQTKNGQFDFTPEMKQKIASSTEGNLQENVDEVMKELGQQVPQSLLGKLDTWRYFSMLANPKTHIRNIVGNFAMGLTQQVKSKVAGTIEQVTGQDRTHTSLFEKRSRANIDFAKNDLKNVSAQLGIGESKYSNPKNQIQQNQRVFKSDALEKSLGRMFKMNDKLLEAEDSFGLKNAYVRNLSDYMTANKLNPKTITNEQLQQARKVAIEEALRATFHQESSLASMLNQIENKNLASRILMGGLVPFKKTPINVAKSGFEYSPAGLAKAIVYDSVQLRKGNINVNEYIDNISKGLTGTGIALVGYALAEAGILKAGGDDDKDEKYRQAMGEQPYSIMINGKSYSLDWLAPTGIPLFVGAELNKLMHDKTEKDGETQNEVLKAMGRIADATTSLLNPMSEMSMISGLTSTIQSFSSDPGQALMNLVVSPVKSYVGQVVPTAVGQVARTMDKYERDTSSTETGLLPKAIDQTKNQMMNKIPGLRQLLPTKKDIWGNEVETQDYFHNAVLPYTKKEIKTNAVDKELNDLYERTGESIYPNTSLSKTVTYEGSKTRLTNQDYNDFKTNYGKTSYKLLEDLTKSQEYKGMTDAQKVQAIKDVYTYANNLNKTEYAEKKGIEFKTPTDVQQVRAVKAYGGKESDYFKYKGITDGLSKDSEKMVALRDSNLSAKSKRAVYSATLGKDDTFFQSTDINVNEYLGYKTANIQGVKDSNGKTISGTKKTAQLDYINNNISGYENRLLLMGKDYKLSRSQQQDLAEYIYTLDNADDLFAMYDKNFTVRDGTVYYK